MQCTSGIKIFAVGKNRIIPLNKTPSTRVGGGRGSGGEWWWLGERGMGTKGIIFPFFVKALHSKMRENSRPLHVASFAIAPF